MPYKDPELKRLANQRFRDAHPEYDKQYYQDNRVDKLAASKIYARSHRADLIKWRRGYEHSKVAQDPAFKLKKNLRQRLRGALQGNAKSGSAVRDLGCSIDDLRRHLEARFAPGMSWANYGQWHIDHVRPLAKFDLTDRQQLLAACHYTNLQPLWASDNLSKGSK